MSAVNSWIDIKAVPKRYFSEEGCPVDWFAGRRLVAVVPDSRKAARKNWCFVADL